MFNFMLAIASLVSLVVMTVMMNFTTPTDIGPSGVLLFFTTGYVLLFGLANLLVRLILKLMGRRSGERKTKLYSAMVAFAPIILLLVRSFGSINWWTLGLVGMFELLSCFLVYKRV